MPVRRHYSWPFSGSASGARAEELRYNPRKIDSSLSTSNPQRFTKRFTAFDQPFGPTLSLYSSSEEDVILSSAGILDSKIEKRELRRQRRERRAEHKRRRHERRQRSAEANKDEDGPTEEIIISSITQANEAPIAIMRRFLWPHLEKARHFFLPLHTFQYLAGSWTSHLRRVGPTDKKSHEIKARYVAKLVSPSAPSLSPKEPSADEAGMSLSIPDRNEWMLRPERRHRRCHSEQPRAWREPNPGLWTLAEE